MIVVDCSALVDAILQSRGDGPVARRVFRGGERINAPHLIDMEAAHTLRRLDRGGKIAPTQATEALGMLKALPIRRFGHEFLLDRIWQLRHNYTAYDAAYVSLAEALDATLVTRDSALAAGLRHRARVELI